MFVDDNTKKIADEVIGLTKAGVTEIWQKIQQAAPELWKLVIRQKMLDGVALGIAGGLGAIIGFIACTISAVDFLGNPAYWALKDILELARGR